MSKPPSRLMDALSGRYSIERQLGEGGMATVYLADDLKHERKVALKVLKPELAAVVGAERFLAEIKTTANLQHPHILPLFDSGEADGFLFYVMPYVEGETLAERLAREKQLPVDEAVRMAVAVAGALQAAHDAGVVHRDIKPGNILMSRGQPLVADFGIALAVGAAGGSRLTETGLSVGTPYYMSPEQATGDQSVGPASDTYALGCVLYEMLVGEPPYLGNTAQAVLGKIIQGLPVSATAARRSVPPNVDAAIRKALEKLPADRFPGADDFAKALGDPSFRYGETAATGAAAARGSRRWLTAGHGALTLALAAVAAWALLRPEPPAPSMKFRMDSGIRGFALAPHSMSMPADGSFLLHNTTDPDAPGDLSGTISVHRFDGLPSTPVPGAEPGFHPAASPDGVEFAYMAATGQVVKAMPVAGGVPRLLADSAACCTSWEHDGWVYYVAVDASVRRVSAAGGGEKEIVVPGPSDFSSGFRGFPRLSRSGKTLFLLAGFTGGERAIDAVRLADGTQTRLILGAASPPLPTPTGHLAYVDIQGRLVAVPFDEAALAITGPPVALADGLLSTPTGVIGSSRSGTLAYLTQASGAATSVVPVWVDREGRAEVIDPEWTFGFGSPSGNRGISLSPDGRRVAVSIYDSGATGDIYIKELPRGPFSRLTTNAGEDTRPRWTPEGDAVTYLGTGPGGYVGYVHRADFTAAEGEAITEASFFEVQMAPGGDWMAARGVLPGGSGMDLTAVPLRGGEEPHNLITPFQERAIAVSPDGRWIAFESDDNGRPEVYIRSFPDLARSKRQVSALGGSQPVWGRTGRELFYIDAERHMVSVPVELGDELVLGEPTVLFELGPDLLFAGPAEFYSLYDVDVDDRRFLMLRSDQAASEIDMVIMLNAFESLKGGG